ncbi:MAG: carbohydrate-binding protein [Fibrobacteres bacterium]|nr:carbohydrate-binding protein [Fibrobacterota bacterium]
MKSLFVLLILSTAVLYAEQVTMAVFGKRTVMPGMVGSTLYGDTWDPTWCSNDSLLVQMNDGVGFTGTDYQHNRICRLLGTPESTSTLVGRNINPGILSNTFSGIPNYSTGLYEVDGILYHNVCYSSQVPGAWVFHHTNMLKSTDGGANWTNHLGQQNVIPADNLNTSFFAREEWGQVNFIKYGKGGVAPDVDNAQTYVYLTATSNGGYFLGRIKRTDLPLLDKTKMQYFKAGDGMQDSAWTNDIMAGQLISLKNGWTGIVYNYGLGRYVMTSFTSDSWLNPPVESTLRIFESLHPWGPWKRVLEENVNYKEGDNLTWAYPIQKFTKADGKKLWITATGRAPYGLQFLPVYLSTSQVSHFEAESTGFAGGALSQSVAGYSGSGYVGGLDAPGDSCVFTVAAAKSGGYLLKLRYHTTGYRLLALDINGKEARVLRVGKSEQTYAVWSELSMAVVLDSGVQTLAFRCPGEISGAVDIDFLDISFYSSDSSDLTADFFGKASSRTPYNGRNTVLPGVVECENYDEGGEGVAFHDLDAVDHGNVYRMDEVDKQSITGGYTICWTGEGEWLKYFVDIPAGLYRITAKTASASTNTNMKLRMLLDNDTLTTIDITPSGSWTTYNDFSAENVQVKAGGNSKTLRLEIIGGSYNVDKITFTATPGTALEIIQSGASSKIGIYNNTASVPEIISDRSIREIEIYNPSGRRLKHFSDVSARRWKYNGQSLSSSLYFIRVKTDAGCAVLKWIPIR